jgi:hypothetical protein
VPRQLGEAASNGNRPQELRCDSAQGYLLARQMAAPDFERRMCSWRARYGAVQQHNTSQIFIDRQD